jgi:hypothetical protein
LLVYLFELCRSVGQFVPYFSIDHVLIGFTACVLGAFLEEFNLFFLFVDDLDQFLDVGRCADVEHFFPFRMNNNKLLEHRDNSVKLFPLMHKQNRQSFILSHNTDCQFSNTILL